MNAATKEFQAETGIAAKIVWMPKSELLEKLPFALDKAELDITYLDHGFVHPRIARALVDLSDLRIEGDFDQSWSLLRLPLDGPTLNFLPIEGLSNAIFYNKDLFQQAGISLPQGRALTDTEFLEIIKKLRAAGITPIGEGASDRTFKAGLPIINTIFRFAGPEKMQLLKAVKMNFSDPDIAAGVAFWKQVVDAQGYDAEKALSLGLEAGIFEVTDGHAAMNFCGTFFYSKYAGTEHERGNIGVLDWFSVPNGKGNDFYEISWAAGFGVNKNSAVAAEGKQFLQFLLSSKAAALWQQYVQAPYPVLAGEQSNQSLYNQLAAQRVGQQQASSFTYQLFMDTAAQNMWDDASKHLITGELSVEDFIKRMNSRLK
ncbi:extracellular solute-binding protein family 1 [Candidatus Moduliflexus flocculans]|uniref:Extracellular solute-binding protein family 1 n=1 Tax=Candidatus Moduliflexus flocculans TaxID=1499966 RepID=A0A0S6VV88_9BACT|nr:extracellular solute-binding protein family 1 [Candidatus Moduliflexus flocculans]